MTVYTLFATSLLAQQLKHWLQDTPFSLHICRTAAELLALSADLDDQFLILDFQQQDPSMSDLLQHLHHQACYPFTIAIGDTGDVNMAVSAHLARVNLYLEKPFSRATLLQHLYQWHDDNPLKVAPPQQQSPF